MLWGAAVLCGSSGKVKPASVVTNREHELLLDLCQADHIGHCLTGDVEDTTNTPRIEETIGTVLQLKIDLKRRLQVQKV
jgi:hypothetical protein